MTISNPILARELKERMRALRAPIVLTIYLLMLGLVVFGVERSVSRNSLFAALAGATAGRTVFQWLLSFLLLFIILMVPAIVAGTISSERERETLHLVQVTTLSPHRIVLGKLGASMAWVSLLTVSTVPLVAVSFVLGGVSLGDVLRGYGYVLFVAATIAMVTIGISARMRRTIGATVLSFLFVATITIGSLIAFGLVRAWTFDNFSPATQTEPVWTVTINPFIATASAIQGRDTGSSADTPMEGIFTFLHESGQPGGFSSSFSTPFSPGGAPPTTGGRAVPIWVISSLEYLALMAIGFAMAVGGVSAPRHTFRSGRRRRKGALEG